ncbi:MAG: hypothetical protein KIT09_17640 [Bryobacteraceae bacterium]|nr:hypothetical protein [Bryobacteraceae bacterium]
MLLSAASLPVAPLRAEDFPQAEISNRVARARLYLPDPAKGYYRGTRFDWSGVISSLQYKGREYFGVWFERHDPSIHDAITGPVEEFRTNGSSLGYEEAAPGGAFVRIGVGAVRKPEEKGYRGFHTYEILDHGGWKVRKGREWIEFTHRLDGPNGYSYVYAKRVSLAKNAPELTIAHKLKNIGEKVIETDQYNHNFFVIDKQPSGPDFVVRFPFDLRATEDMKGLAEARGREVVFLRELPPGESVFTPLEGFGSSAADYAITVENRKTGAKVEITGDRPLTKVNFWSIRTTVCPEPYISLRVEPGREAAWTLRYRFE